MIPIVLESPYKGCRPLHRAYLQALIRDAIQRNETPYSSHQQLTEALDDDDPVERALGIETGLQMAEHLLGVAGGTQVFGLDFGWTVGMNIALGRGQSKGWAQLHRELGDYDATWLRILMDAASFAEQAGLGQLARFNHIFADVPPALSARGKARTIKARWEAEGNG